MSLHGNPQCAASRFALHLEQTYGLQLDPYRHRQLVAELEEFTGRVDEPERLLIAAEDSTDEPLPSDPADPETGFFKFYPCGCSAGPGPRNMPDYCSEHGSADKPDCVTTFGHPGVPVDASEGNNAA